MDNWHKRFFSTTRGDVIQLLRREHATVADLAEKLDLSKNAIRSHLTRLERDGLVRVVGKRPSSRKPATIYGLTEDAEKLYPKAYDLLFEILLEKVTTRLGSEVRQDLLDAIGRELARRSHLPNPDADLRIRIDHAIELIGEIGGLAEMKGETPPYKIEGFSCPLSGVVADHPDVCRIAQALLEELTGANVRECCNREGTPECRFVIIQ